MIRKPSGPYCDSFIAVDGPAASPAAMELRLCNFPTGHSELLPDHVAALWKYIGRAMWTSQGAWIDLVGYASKLGYAHNDSGNLTLSRARCAAVKNVLNPVLSRMGSRFRFNMIDGRGDTESQDDPTLDHGFYRAVLVRLFAQGAYHFDPIPVPPPHIWTPKPSDWFEFKAVEGASVTGGLFEASTMIFSMHDLINLRTRYYGYKGIGVSAPIPKLPAVGFSVGHGASAVQFHTLTPIVDMKDFEGQGNIEGFPGATLGPNSVGGKAIFTMRPDAYSRRGIHNPLRVTFSFSAGFGANLKDVTAGSIKMLDTSFRPTVYSR